MSTTVIASRHRDLSAALLPSASPRLDVESVRAVLSRHGLALIDGSDLATANTLVVAEGLSPREAQALADDLRAVGLHARVVNRTGLTTSQRMGSIAAGQFMLWAAGFMAFLIAAAPMLKAFKRTGVLFDGNPWWLLPGALMMVWAAFNAWTLAQHGGASLRIAGTRSSSDPAGLVEQLHRLADGLPDHLTEPLVAKARRLESHVRSAPDGQAAQELEAVLDALLGLAEEAAVKEAQGLRRDVAAAARAVAEVRSGSSEGR